MQGPFNRRSPGLLPRDRQITQGSFLQTPFQKQPLKSQKWTRQPWSETFLPTHSPSKTSRRATRARTRYLWSARPANQTNPTTSWPAQANLRRLVAAAWFPIAFATTILIIPIKIIIVMSWSISLRPMFRIYFCSLNTRLIWCIGAFKINPGCLEQVLQSQGRIVNSKIQIATATWEAHPTI